MLLTAFLALVFCAAVTLLLVSAVAFVQDTRLFSSAPREARALLKPRKEELFHGARTMGHPNVRSFANRIQILLLCV